MTQGETPAQELQRIVDELTPVLYYAMPVTDAQWRADKAAYLARMRGETTTPASEDPENEKGTR